MGQQLGSIVDQLFFQHWKVDFLEIVTWLWQDSDAANMMIL